MLLSLSIPHHGVGNAVFKVLNISYLQSTRFFDLDWGFSRPVTMDTFLNKWRLCIIEALLNISTAFQDWLTHKCLSSLAKIRTELKERTKSLMLIPWPQRFHNSVLQKSSYRSFHPVFLQEGLECSFVHRALAWHVRSPRFNTQRCIKLAVQHTSLIPTLRRQRQEEHSIMIVFGSLGKLRAAWETWDLVLGEGRKVVGTLPRSPDYCDPWGQLSQDLHPRLISESLCVLKASF